MLFRDHALKRFPIKWNRKRFSSFCVVAFSDGKPVTTFPENAPKQQGVASLSPPPLDLPFPGGGDVCRASARFGGTGQRPVPGFEPPAGATNAGGTPHSVQALPSRSATNLIPSPDFTRINTVRLPSFCASRSESRTSFGLATFLPPTSRITSPVLKP
jgi:hypothetical protein